MSLKLYMRDRQGLRERNVEIERYRDRMMQEYHKMLIDNRLGNSNCFSYSNFTIKEICVSLEMQILLLIPHCLDYSGFMCNSVAPW